MFVAFKCGSPAVPAHTLRLVDMRAGGSMLAMNNMYDGIMQRTLEGADIAVSECWKLDGQMVPRGMHGVLEPCLLYLLRNALEHVEFLDAGASTCFGIVLTPAVKAVVGALLQESGSVSTGRVRYTDDGVAFLRSPCTLVDIPCPGFGTLTVSDRRGEKASHALLDLEHMDRAEVQGLLADGSPVLADVCLAGEAGWVLQGVRLPPEEPIVRLHGSGPPELLAAPMAGVVYLRKDVREHWRKLLADRGRVATPRVVYTSSGAAFLRADPMCTNVVCVYVKTHASDAVIDLTHFMHDEWCPRCIMDLWRSNCVGAKIRFRIQGGKLPLPFLPWTSMTSMAGPSSSSSFVRGSAPLPESGTAVFDARVPWR